MPTTGDPGGLPAAGAAGARVFPLGPGVLERVADTVTPQPVLRRAAHAAHARPGRPDVVAAACPPGRLVVVLVDVRDPGNAGTVLRAADASGSTAVVFAADSVDPYNPKTVRASAGSLFHVPLAVRHDPLALAAELSAAGFRTLATVVRGGEDYAALDWSVPTALFLGNEASGLDPALGRRAGGSLGHPDGRAGPSRSTSAWPVPWSASRPCANAGAVVAGPRSISADADEGDTPTW